MSGPGALVNAVLRPNIYTSPKSTENSPQHENPEWVVELLNKIIPKLVKWRLLVFYAPFYEGEEFTSPTLEHKAQDEAMVRYTSRLMRKMLGQIASEYAAHKARQQASAVLESIEHEAIPV